MQNRKYLVFTLSFILFLVIFLGLLGIYTAQQRLAVFNLQSYDRYGLKASGLLLEQAGFRLQEIDALPQNQSKVMIVLTDGTIPTHQLNRLNAWVHSGGTLVELARTESILTNNLRKTRYTKFSGSDCVSGNKGFNGVMYYPKNDVLAGCSDPDEGYFADDHQHYFIYRIRFGKGSIIVWNDLEGLTNIHLKRHPDNAVVLALLLKTLPGSKQLLIYDLTDAGAVPGITRFQWETSLFNRYWGALLLFLTAIALLLWKTAARFGRPRPLQIAQGRSYHEFVASLAHLFQMARLQGAVADNLWQALLQTASQITGLPVSTQLNVMAEKLRTLTGKEYNLPLLQKEAAEVSDTPARARNRPGKRSFIEIAQTLDTCRRELTAWIKSNNW